MAKNRPKYRWLETNLHIYHMVNGSWTFLGNWQKNFFWLLFLKNIFTQPGRKESLCDRRSLQIFILRHTYFLFWSFYCGFLFFTFLFFLRKHWKESKNYSVGLPRSFGCLSHKTTSGHNSRKTKLWLFWDWPNKNSLGLNQSCLFVCLFLMDGSLSWGVILCKDYVFLSRLLPGAKYSLTNLVLC